MNVAADPQPDKDPLADLVGEERSFDYDYAEMAPRQLEAANARLAGQIGKIKLLQHRAETGGVTEIRRMADIVPLLFAHTAYKSYPENWLSEQKWDRLGRWLDTISTNRVPAIDTSGVKGLDDWLDRLGEVGHYVSCSSGTTGKCAMMNATTKDLEFCADNLLQAVIWAGLKPSRDRRIVGTGQAASTPRNRAAGVPMYQAMSRPDLTPFTPDVPLITIGGITEMVVLRKKMAEGAATPNEVAYYESQVVERQKQADSAIDQTAEALIEHRHEKLLVSGMFASLFRVAEAVRARGRGGKDFNPENGAFLTGGLKRAQVPENYREYIFETFNLRPENIVMIYSMQELNSSAPRCAAGRYHMPPWLMLLLLDESGETLIEPPRSGGVEGRAAFFDISMDGRWGGVISGDKVHATWEPCACGHRSPSIAEDIQRYADMAGGDKIACAGTIDAYVRAVG